MKCPNCGGIVRAVDTLDTEYYGNSYYDSVEGVCPDCGVTWQWVEVFTFDHVEDVRPINVDDHL